MPQTPDPAPREHPAETAAFLPAFLRLFWMGLGNALLFLMALLMARGSALAIMSTAFFAVAAAIVAARCADIAWFQGRRADGSPASFADAGRHGILVAAASAALWFLARLVSARGWLQGS